MSGGPVRQRTSSAIEVQHQTDERGNSTGSFRIATQVEEHAVALPSAAELQALKDVDPSVLAMFVTQVSKEGDHRRAMQVQAAEHQRAMDVEDRRYRQAATDGKLSLAKRGQQFGLVIGVLGLGTTALAVWTGNPWLAGVLGTLNLGGMISAFLKSHAPKVHEEDDAEAMPEPPPAQKTTAHLPEPEREPEHHHGTSQDRTG